MLVPAWKVATWKPVVTTRHEFDENVAQFSHLGTAVHADAMENGLMYGQVVWGATMPDGMVGLAWDWMEVKEAVVAIADPMMIVSNLRLVDDAGESVSESERIVCMNNAIHALGWQSQLRHLRSGVPQALAA